MNIENNGFAVQNVGKVTGDSGYPSSAEKDLFESILEGQTYPEKAITEFATGSFNALQEPKSIQATDASDPAALLKIQETVSEAKLGPAVLAKVMGSTAQAINKLTSMS